MSFKNNISFVKKELENDDIYTFYFNKPKGLVHKAGQHGIFIITGLYRPHPFTLSSAPEEEYIAFSTHTGTGSKYKKRLMSMKSGESILLLGPVLNFTFTRDTNRYVFLAQGIGITPFRSMLLHAHTAGLSVETTLIHVDSKRHTFKEITSRSATTAYYPTNADEFRQLVARVDSNQAYYVSGSPRFIRQTLKFLIEKGVAKQNIKTDSFLGY